MATFMTTRGPAPRANLVSSERHRLDQWPAASALVSLESKESSPTSRKQLGRTPVMRRKIWKDAAAHSSHAYFCLRWPSCPAARQLQARPAAAAHKTSVLWTYYYILIFILGSLVSGYYNKKVLVWKFYRCRRQILIYIIRITQLHVYGRTVRVRAWCKCETKERIERRGDTTTRLTRRAGGAGRKTCDERGEAKVC